MNEILEMIMSNLLPIFGSILTAVVSYIGIQIKNLINSEMKKREVNHIVEATVNYVEQITKNTDMTAAEKFSEAKTKILEWLHEKKITISDTQLDILIECAVKRLT